MTGIEISVKRARRAIVVGWVAFGVSLFMCLLSTLAFWFYTMLPDLLEMLAEEEGMPGMITMEMLDPSVIEAFFSCIWSFAEVAAIAIGVAIIFWWLWFSKFVDNRKSKRMGGFAASLSSLIPGFGVFIHYFIVKDALAVLESEFEERGTENKSGIARAYGAFALWFWAVVAAMGFLTFSTFGYWLMILFVEFVCFTAFFRYIKLMSALKSEEEKLV